jgi:hypothetical protein
MPSGSKLWLKRLAAWLATTALLLLLLPMLDRTLGLGSIVSVGLLMLLGYAIVLLGIPFFIVGIPFAFWVMGENVYRVLFKPYVRAWHINHIRNSRLLREASARRGNSE